MLNAVLVDDEKKARENLRIFLERIGSKVKVVGEAESALEAYNVIKELKPDLVFLDIEMPGGTGFNLLGLFDKIDFEVIFVTAYGHYAIQAIKFSALGYIMKPINIDDLTEAVDKAIEKRTSGPISGVDPNMMKELIEGLKGKEKLKKLFIPDMYGFSVVETDTIMYCKAEGNYTEIFSTVGKTVCTKSLKDFQEALPTDQFYRINKSYIINSDFISKYKKGSGGVIIMADKHEIDVPRRGKEEFLNFIDQSRI